MSTRAVIQIKKTTKYEGINPNNGEHRLQYYHHFDGYTSYLGIELVKILLDFINEQDPEKIKSIDDIRWYMENILTQRYQIEDPKIIHGDIEYFYLIDFDDGITLTRFKRNDFEKDKPDYPEKWADKHILLKVSLQEKYYRLELIDYSYKFN